MSRSLGLALFGVFVLSLPGAGAQDQEILRLANAGKPAARFATSALVAQNVHGRRTAIAPDAWERLLPNISAPKGRERAIGFAFAGVTMSDFSHLETVGCDQLAVTDCSVERRSLGPAVGMLVRPFDAWPVGFGARAGRSRVSVDQAFVSTPFPTRNVIDLDVWTATAFADAWVRLDDQTRLVGTAGYLWSWNRGTVTSTFADRVDVVHRNEHGGRYTIGGAFERDVWSKSWLRLEYRFIDGDTGDADRQHQFGLLAGFPVFGARAAGRTTGARPIDRFASIGDPWRPHPGARPIGGGGQAVPRLTGLSAQRARIALDSVGFASRLTHRPSSEPAGDVIGQGPAIAPPPIGAARTRRGLTTTGVEARPIVDLVVAAGIAVPSIVGVSSETALDLIIKAGLTPGEVRWVESDLPPGSLVSQDPDPETVVPLDTPINLILSGVRVPNLVGTQLQADPTMALPAGRIDTIPSPHPIGSVATQRPLPGTFVAPGSAIDISIAAGTVVPDVERVALSTATDSVERAGLRSGTVTRVSSDLDAGTVLGQVPAAGDTVPLDTPVNLQVSSGPRVTSTGTDTGGEGGGSEPTLTVTVPALVGTDTAAARLALEAAGLEFGTITFEPSREPPGIVTGMSPTFDSSVARGTEIDLTVARNVSVPNLSGLDSLAAASLARDSFFVPEFDPRFSSDPPGSVLEQHPPAGALLRPGDPLVLVIARPILPLVLRGMGLLAVLAGLFAAFRRARPKRRPSPSAATRERQQQSGLATKPDPRATPPGAVAVKRPPVPEFRGAPGGPAKLSIEPQNPHSGLEIRSRPVMDEGTQAMDSHDSPIADDSPLSDENG